MPDAHGGGLRRRLADGDTVLGTMVFEFNTLGVPRIVAEAGADFLLVDLEHTGWSVEAIRPLLAASRAESVVPLVRVHAAARHQVSVALDAGATGVMVAMVDDAGGAEAAVQAARFPPRGRRGFGLVYPDQVADGVAPAIEAAEAETVVVLQIETLAGLERVEEIAATPGVDVLWLGQFDLTLSLGVPGALDDPRLREAEDRIVEACADADLAAGVLAGDLETARLMLDRGFRMIALGTDINLYGQALRRGLTALRPGREH